MRVMLYLVAVSILVGLAFWAYDENLETQRALREVRNLQSDIGRLRDGLAVQRAEWAYLNRPDRLRDLADLNFEILGLVPMTPLSLGRVEEVPFAPVGDEATALPAVLLGDVNMLAGAVDIAGRLDVPEAGDPDDQDAAADGAGSDDLNEDPPEHHAEPDEGADTQ